jgi:hypothetical protein
MRLKARVVAAAQISMMGASAWAGESDAMQTRSVTVCMSGSHEIQVTYRAQETASKIFAGIGVLLVWSTRGSCPSSPDVVRVNLSNETSEKQLPAALAYSLSYEGTHIVVFYDRIKKSVKSVSTDRLLAHVLVHEITHILQGLDGHSESGIMKARWDNSDLARMGREPLGFTDFDVLLLYRGLDARQAWLEPR